MNTQTQWFVLSGRKFGTLAVKAGVNAIQTLASLTRIEGQGNVVAYGPFDGLKAAETARRTLVSIR